MKAIHFLLLAILMICSCDDRFEFIKKNNLPPSIYFNDEFGVSDLSDSLKNGLKFGGPTYSITLNGVDYESELTSLSFDVETGSVRVFLGDQPINSNFPLINGKASIKIEPEFGLNVIKFSATDNVGKTSYATLKLFAYDNLKPLAIVKFAPSGGPYEYEFDASDSFDQDMYDGGEVKVYQYYINDHEPFKTTKPKINFDFGGPGGYTVKYRVIDNEGLASDLITNPRISL